MESIVAVHTDKPICEIEIRDLPLDRVLLSSQSLGHHTSFPAFVYRSGFSNLTNS